jgi:hypothetical protein
MANNFKINAHYCIDQLQQTGALASLTPGHWPAHARFCSAKDNHTTRSTSKHLTLHNMVTTNTQSPCAFCTWLISLQGVLLHLDCQDR